MTKQRRLSWSALPLSFLLALPVPALGQRTPQKKPSKPVSEKPAPKLSETALADSELPAFAVSLVISLATEARSYSDLALRPRVLARAADVLWDTDNITARALFKRAWEAAEQGDADEVTIKTKDKPPAMVTALRRMSGRDLRFEVLSVMAKRDRALSEEYFAKLKSETDSSKKETKDSSPPNDGWSVPEAVSKRLQVASALLKDGQPERALEFAAPVLTHASVHTIGFLSELRKKNAEAADRVFLTLLNRAEADPASDANTVSGLSSYVFTPGLYITFNPEGGTRWTQPEEPPVPPVNFPTALRDRFFQVAASILLRPLLPSDPLARSTKLNVIKRLLPLFEQHSPDTATALRTQLQELSNNSSRDLMEMNNPMLTQGISPLPSADDVLEQMQKRLDRARTPRERDSIYAAAASSLIVRGDERARDIADKIEDVERRTEIRQHIDFEFIQRAIKRKATTEAIRLAQTGKLSNTQRASAYIDVARLLLKTERQEALHLLEEAVREVNRIEGNKPDRAVLLVGIAHEFLVVDRVRAWEIIGEVVKEANRFEGFTGSHTIHFPLMTSSSFRVLNIGGENFSLTNVFRALAKDDLYRAVDVAKSFKYDAARATVTLAIASSILTRDLQDSRD
ncbi:MAG TPA: hypothetical protein VFU83_03090 [Pyrinomonadaceae bacterium]|nr:hypothetical protein [Pyrinomonadaceae bacterium]